MLHLLHETIFIAFGERKWEIKFVKISYFSLSNFQPTGTILFQNDCVQDMLVMSFKYVCLCFPSPYYLA